MIKIFKILSNMNAIKRIKLLFRNNDGFSLIEILIATVIGSFMMVMLYTSYSQMIKYVNISTENAEFYENLNLAIMKIDRDFSNMYMNRENKNLALIAEAETETSSKINFVTVDHNKLNVSGDLEKNNPASDIHEVGYYLRESKYPNEYELIKREDIHYDEEPDKGGVENLLLEGVTEFIVEFKQGNDWTVRWDTRETRRFPRAIKTTLKIKHASTLRHSRANKEHEERIEEFVFITLINKNR